MVWNEERESDLEPQANEMRLRVQRMWTDEAAFDTSGTVTFPRDAKTCMPRFRACGVSEQKQTESRSRPKRSLAC